MELNEISYTAHDSGPYSLFVPSQDDNGWYAGFWLRVFASLWDVFILGILQILLIQTASWAISDSSLDVLLGQLLTLSERDLDSLNHHLFLLLLFAPTPCILFVAYFSLFESGRLGATPGKLLMGICVIDYDDNPPGLKQSVFRNTMKLLWMPVYLTGIALTAAVAQGSESILAQGLLILSTLSTLLLFLFTYSMIAFNADKQSFYDEWANCFVVRKDRVSWRRRLILALLILLIYLWLLWEYLPRVFRESGSSRGGMEEGVPVLEIPSVNSSLPVGGGTGGMPAISISGEGDGLGRGQSQPGLGAPMEAGSGGTSFMLPEKAGTGGAGNAGPMSVPFDGREPMAANSAEQHTASGGLAHTRGGGSSSVLAPASEAAIENHSQDPLRTPLKGLRGLLVVDGKIVPASKLIFSQKSRSVELGMIDEQNLEIATLKFSFDRFADHCGLDSLRFYSIDVSPERIGYSNDMVVEFVRSMFSLGERDVRDIHCSFNSSGFFSVHVKGRGIIRRHNETILPIEWVIVPIKDGIVPQRDRSDERKVPFSSIARIEEKENR